MTAPIARLAASVAGALAQSGADFEVINCDPDLADTADFCRHYGYPADDCANAILVRSKAGEPQYVLCVLLATTRLDVNRVIRKRLGVRKASFASGEETRALTGMEIGGVTPIALPNDLPIWIDEAVTQRKRIILGAGIRDAKIITTPDFLLRGQGALAVPGLAY